MEQMLKNLNDGLIRYLAGEISLQEIEDTLTTPIIISDESDNLDAAVLDIVYMLDSWEINNLVKKDIQAMSSELTKYLQQNN